MMLEFKEKIHPQIKKKESLSSEINIKLTF